MSKPNPSLVVACLALAIALGGTAYAASLPRNSVGSPQVKPNSLKGADIKESTLSGVLLATGNARARSRIIAAGTPFTTLLTIPKVGRIDVTCGMGPSADMRIYNTTKSDAFVWNRETGLSGINVHAGQYTGSTVNGLEIADLIVRSTGPKRITVIHFAASIVAGVSCNYSAIAESVARP